MLKSKIIHLRKINNITRGRIFLTDFKYVCFVLIFERLQVPTCDGKIQNDARKFCQNQSLRGLRMYWLIAGFGPSVKSWKMPNSSNLNKNESYWQRMPACSIEIKVFRKYCAKHFDFNQFYAFSLYFWHFFRLICSSGNVADSCQLS